MYIHSNIFFFFFQLSVSVGWDEGVIGMQIGEVARLRVMLTTLSLTWSHLKDLIAPWIFCVTQILTLWKFSP